MTDSEKTTRRDFIRTTAVVGGALVLTGYTGALGAGNEAGADVTPIEDLMREHGVLERTLLIYEEAVRRLEAKEEMGRGLVADAAGVIQAFIEDYHELLEENHLFVRFRKADKLVELVDVLEAQHKMGRKVTDHIIKLANAEVTWQDDDRRRLVRLMREFARMYWPHLARENTVLFPALHEVVSAREYGALGDEFEKKETQLFGERGFEKMVERVAALEKGLGIYELKQFTPTEF